MLRTIVRIAAYLAAALVLLGLIGFTYITTRGIPSYPVETIDFTATATPENIERGKKLASMLCAQCHLNKETGKLTGAHMSDAPAEFGTIHSPNITQDKIHGIGDWTDAELLYLLRTGIKRDGQYSPPYMAKLPTMADADINAIIAYLRSDDPILAADPTPSKVSEPGFLTKLLSNIVWKPFPMPTASIPMPDTSNQLALGKYLAHNLECFSCHSASFQTNDFLAPENSTGYFGGGNVLLNQEGQEIVSSNLTPDKITGIGSWSEEDFVKATKYGFKEGQNALQYPMLPYTQLTDKEAGAIYQYLMTIPPISNEVVSANL